MLCVFNLNPSIAVGSSMLNLRSCDMVIFSSVKDINIAINHLKPYVKDLKTILKVSLEIAPENGKSVIFIQPKYIDRTNIYLDENTLPLLSLTLQWLLFV